MIYVNIHAIVVVHMCISKGIDFEATPYIPGVASKSIPINHSGSSG